MNNTQKLSFDCTCNGCRNYPTRPADIWHTSQLEGKTQGYFFKPSSMRMFSSRISDFKPVGISKSVISSLYVIVSSKYGIEGASRYYEILIVCPYGNVSRDWQDEGRELAKFDTLAKARKSPRWTGNAPRPVCNCHGCQLDEVGRE